MSYNIGEGSVFRGFAMPASLDAQVRERCAKTGVSLSAFVREAVRKALDIPAVVDPRLPKPRKF
jgi:hypothetical protein